MALKWQIAQINKIPSEGSLSNVCKKIEWVVSESDPVERKKYQAYKLGVVTLESASSDSFTAFETITEDTCVSWVKNVLGSSEVTAIETDVNNQISEQKAGTMTTGLPWSS
tara:strand:- start:411 stop:743 length:333 start_codon:yes stop_codon:yes gene_type:complete